MMQQLTFCMLFISGIATCTITRNGTNGENYKEDILFSTDEADISILIQHDADSRVTGGEWYINVDFEEIKPSLGCKVPDAVLQRYEFHEKSGSYRGYYLLDKNVTLSWQQALNHCTQDGAHLGIINSEDEAYLFRDMYYANPTHLDDAIQESYVGVSDIDDEGYFVTIFGTPLSATGYSDWGSGEPNNGGGRYQGEDCVTYHKKNYLNDINCDNSMFFYCEFELS